MVLSKRYFIYIIYKYYIFYYAPIKTQHINNYLKIVVSYETFRGALELLGRKWGKITLASCLFLCVLRVKGD